MNTGSCKGLQWHQLAIIIPYINFWRKGCKQEITNQFKLMKDSILVTVLLGKINEFSEKILFQSLLSKLIWRHCGWVRYTVLAVHICRCHVRRIVHLHRHRWRSCSTDKVPCRSSLRGCTNIGSWSVLICIVWMNTGTSSWRLLLSQNHWGLRAQDRSVWNGIISAPIIVDLKLIIRNL